MLNMSVHFLVHWSLLFACTSVYGDTVLLKYDKIECEASANDSGDFVIVRINKPDGEYEIRQQNDAQRATYRFMAKLGSGSNNQLRFDRGRPMLQYRPSKLIDFNGDGIVDLGHVGQKLYGWSGQHLIRVSGRSLETTRRFASEERGETNLRYHFADGKWYWSTSGVPHAAPPREERARAKDIMELPEDASSLLPPNIEPLPPNFTNIPKPQETDVAKSKWTFVSKRLAEGRSVENWIDANDGTSYVRIAFSPRMIIALGVDESQRVTASINGHITLDLEEKTKIGQRTKLNLRNNIYEDLNGDGSIDGFHKQDVGATLVLDDELRKVKSCDWKNGEASDSENQYCFANGKWAVRGGIMESRVLE